MEKLEVVDRAHIGGKTSPSVGGAFFSRAAEPARGKIFVVLVPEASARTIVSPAFIQGLRRVAEMTKVLPIIRVVRGWRGVSR